MLMVGLVLTGDATQTQQSDSQNEVLNVGWLIVLGFCARIWTLMYCCFRNLSMTCLTLRGFSWKGAMQIFYSCSSKCFVDFWSIREAPAAYSRGYFISFGKTSVQQEKH